MKHVLPRFSIPQTPATAHGSNLKKREHKKHLGNNFGKESKPPHVKRHAELFQQVMLKSYQ